jgi:hypothetical protein
MGRQRIAAHVALVILALAAAGCGGQKKEYGDDVLAVINGHPVTVADVQSRLDALPEEAKKDMNNPSMLSAFINGEINERVWAEAAREAGYDQSEEFKRRLALAEDAILAQMYSEHMKEKLAQPTEEEIDQAYELEKDKNGDPEVHARQIFCATEEKAKMAMDAVNGGMSFEEAVARFSEDSNTRDKGGDMGTLSRSSAIPGFGIMPDLFDAIAKLNPGQIGGPIHTRSGYHIVQLLSKSGAGRMTAGATRAQIEKRLKKERAESGVSGLQSELWNKLHVQVFDNAIKTYIGYPITPEQFVRQIQECTTSGDKVQLCRQMLAQFPNDKYAPWAQFTLGFVYSEELHNYALAEEEFRGLLKRYPDSSWAEPARWMIENMKGEHPPLKDPDDVKARAKAAAG